MVKVNMCRVLYYTRIFELIINVKIGSSLLGIDWSRYFFQNEFSD